VKKKEKSESEREGETTAAVPTSWLYIKMCTQHIVEII
jgi:hypothetical protein